MKWVLLAILLLTVIVLIIFFTKVKIFLDYFHGNDNDHFNVTIRAWGGLIKFKIEVPVVKIDDNSPTIIAEQKIKTGPDESMKQQKTTQVDKNNLLDSLHDFEQLITHVAGLHKIVRNF